MSDLTVKPKKIGISFTMACNIERMIFDIKQEKDALVVNKIKIEPQDVPCEVKTEQKECNRLFEPVEIKREIVPLISIKKIPEVKKGEYLEDFEKKQKRGAVTQSTDAETVDGTRLDILECGDGHTEDETICQNRPIICGKSTNKAYTCNDKKCEMKTEAEEYNNSLDMLI